MSTSMIPSSSNLSQLSDQAQNWWKTDAGKWGKGVVIGGGLALAAAIALNITTILGFLAGVLSGTIAVLGMLYAIVALCIGLLVIGAIAMNPAVHAYFRLKFQSMMDTLYMKVIRDNPLSSLRADIEDMEKTDVKVDKLVIGLSGQKRTQADKIQAKKQEVMHLISLIEETDQEIADMKVQLSHMNPDDPAYLELQLKIDNYGLKSKQYAVTMGMEKNAIGTYEDSLKECTQFYALMVRASNYGKYNIGVSKSQLDIITDQYNFLHKGSEAVGEARKYLKRSPESQKRLDMTMQFLQQDFSARRGEMDDFVRFSQSSFDGMDIEQGALARDSKARIQDWEKKLAAPRETVQLIPDSNGVMVPVKAAAPAVTPAQALPSTSYDDIFNK